MPESDTGWTWFEGSDRENGNSTSGNIGEASRLAAQCFRGPDGARFLRYLRTLTTERVLAPDASSELLRYLEGQRHLVAYLETLVRRGQGVSEKPEEFFEGQHNE